MFDLWEILCLIEKNNFIVIFFNLKVENRNSNDEKIKYDFAKKIQLSDFGSKLFRINIYFGERIH